MLDKLLNKLRSNRIQREKKERNNSRQMYVVMYLFVLLFLCMMGNFIYYIYFQSPEDINSSYNPRQEKLAAKVIRGEILSEDGQVLAKTVVNDDGTETRYYPFGKNFAHIVGFTDRGKTGIESIANISLLTSNAQLGEKISNDISEEKNIGDNIVTTLDVRLQEACVDALGVYRGSIVVTEPKTGRILAMVSNPGFDPNSIATDWEDLKAQTGASPLINRATQGLYPPGSTFKIVTLLEYLRENDDPDEYTYDCSGHYSFGGVTINCFHGSVHGVVNLKKSFAKSCNSSFANIGSMLDGDKFAKTAEDLLFNKKIPIKLPYKESSFSFNDDSMNEERLHTAIGQGKTLITPIHMNMITNAIANDGVAMKPYVIDRIESYEGVVVKQYKAEEYKRLITEKEAAFLDEYMQAVVNEGTGSKLSGQSYLAAGKTGSAEYNDEKGESHSWFTGYAGCPKDEDDLEMGFDPKISVTVIVEGAGSGSEYAVPMAKRVFDTYFQ